jgi:hypothetical protein
MAELEKDIIIKIDGDGEVVFPEIGYNEWTSAIKAEEKSENVIDDVLAKVKEVRGFKKDGKDVSLEDFKKSIPLRIAAQVAIAYNEHVKNFFSGQGAAGNAQTPAS